MAAGFTREIALPLATVIILATQSFYFGRWSKGIDDRQVANDTAVMHQNTAIAELAAEQKASEREHDKEEQKLETEIALLTNRLSPVRLGRRIQWQQTESDHLGAGQK